jgi:hypothetical protein
MYTVYINQTRVHQPCATKPLQDLIAECPAFDKEFLESKQCVRQ